MKIDEAVDVLTDLLRHAWLWQHHFSKEAAEIALDTVLSELRRLQEGGRTERTCETCGKHHTMDCSNSSECYALKDRPHWRKMPDATALTGAGEDV